jgi:hypothetical protein
MSLINHNHKWEVVWAIGDRAVRRCMEQDCGIFESLVLDLSDNTAEPFKWVPGNLWMDEAPIFIVTNTYEEYQEAATLISRNIGITNITRLDTVSKVQGISHPTILFFGTWYDSDIIRDPAFTYLLNRSVE